MSYIRATEHNNAGLYIYPQEGGINFCSFPNHSGLIFPDECIDILLAKISEKELIQRKEHGHLLLKALSNKDFDKYKKNRIFNFGRNK